MKMVMVAIPVQFLLFTEGNINQFLTIFNSKTLFFEASSQRTLEVALSPPKGNRHGESSPPEPSRFTTSPLLDYIPENMPKLQKSPSEESQLQKNQLKVKLTKSGGNHMD